MIATKRWTALFSKPGRDRGLGQCRFKDKSRVGLALAVYIQLMVIVSLSHSEKVIQMPTYN